MFKAKILSLYFPNRFLAVCSKEALEVLAGETGPDGDLRWGLFVHITKIETLEEA
jgi:hypothetical protein